MQSISMPVRLQPRQILHPTYTNYVLLSPKPIGLHPFKKCHSPKRLYRLVHRATQSSTGGTGDDDRLPLETAFKLYTAFKNQNLKDVAELVTNGDKKGFSDLPNKLLPIFKNQNLKDLAELVINGDKKGFSYLPNYLLPMIYYIYGKQKMWELLSSFMTFLGNNIEFVIRPDLKHDVPEVGIKWYIDWKGNPVLLGNGCSFHIAHTYYGKFLISNWRVMVESLIPVEPLTRKLEEIIMPTLDKIAPQLKGKTRAAFMVSLPILLSMAITLILWNNAFM